MPISDDLCGIPATEIAKRIRAGDVTPMEVAEQVVARIEAVNRELNAFSNFDRAQVRRDAARLTELQHGGAELGPPHGVRYSLEDLTAVAGLPLTFGPEQLRDNIPEQDAAVVARMRAAGGLFLGKTNTIEGGYHCGGIDNHLFGPRHNPWKHGTIAGRCSTGC